MARTGAAADRRVAGRPLRPGGEPAVRPGRGARRHRAHRPRRVRPRPPGQLRRPAARLRHGLLDSGTASDWGICGVGLLPGDEHMRDVLAEQDCLYTVLIKYPDGSRSARVIGSVVEYRFAPDDPEAVVETMAREQVRIVSLTITEGGYDPARARGEPNAFDLVTEALTRRRARGVPPFTVLSCDNVPHNGDVARRAFAGFAAERDRELGAWMAEQVAFPNTMVDRITPVTTDDDREALADAFGVGDGWPVVCEPFSQWVVEDRFPAGRPPLQDAGAQLVDDVHPYELMKLRLLNAGHQLLGHLGRLAGLEWVHDACHDPQLRRLLVGYGNAEALPTLPPVPGIDLRRYVGDLLERFGNLAANDRFAACFRQTRAAIGHRGLRATAAQLLQD